MAIAEGTRTVDAHSRREFAAIRVERACAWTGPVLLVVFLGAFVVLCRMWPPRPPLWTPDQIKAFYLEDTSAKRVGLALCLFAWTLMVPWGCALAAQTARIEGGFRILSVMQVLCASTFMVIGELMLLIWAVNTFRPDDMAADTIRVLNDLGWFIFVMYWAPGVLWTWSVFGAVLLDKGPDPVFPRWVGYLNFWIGLSFFPACLGLFFKSGPFAYNGVIVVWIPACLFFVWYGVMTGAVLRTIRRREQALTT